LYGVVKTADQQVLVAMLRARIDRVVNEHDSSAVLAQAALDEAGQLTKLLESLSSADRLEGLRLLGSLYWYRNEALGPGRGASDRALGVDLLGACFANGCPDALIPPAAMPEVARAAVRAAWALTDRTVAERDHRLARTAERMWRRIVKHTADDPRRPIYFGRLALTLYTHFQLVGLIDHLDEAIEAGRSATRTAPIDHPHRSAFHAELSGMLLDRFEVGNAICDLDEAVEMGRLAVRITPDGYPDRVRHLDGLHGALRARYGQTREFADLDEAVKTGRLTVQAVPARDPDRPMYLNNLGDGLRARGELTGSRADLDDAVEAGRLAVAETPAGHRSRAGRMAGLAASVHARYRHTGDSAGLEEAIRLGREALSADPAGAASARSNLCAALQDRFTLTGDVGDLDEAVVVGRSAVRAAPPDHPSRATVMHVLANALKARYEATGAGDERTAIPSHLDEAVHTLRQAAEILPEDHPDHAGSLIALGNALRQRFGRTGNPVDLDEAIEAWRRATRLGTTTDSDRALALNNLSGGLRERYDHAGDVADLEEAIRFGRQAVQAGDGHRDHAMYLNNLGMGLRSDYVRTGRLEDLDEAVEMIRRSTRDCPGDHPERHTFLDHLGVVLQNRHQRTGDLADLDEAIRAGREAARADDSAGIGHLSNLGGALLLRFERTGASEDLDEAVTICRRAVTQRRSGGQEDTVAHVGSLTFLGLALQARYERTRMASDLDEAVETVRESLRETPAEHTGRATILNLLGTALVRRHEHAHEQADLVEAAALVRQAIETTPAGHPALVMYQSNLAAAVLYQHRLSADPAALDEALRLCGQAVDAAPADHPLRATCLFNLGEAASQRFTRSGDQGDLDTAVDAFVEITASAVNAPSDRVRAGVAAGRLLAGTNVTRAAATLASAVGLLHEVAPRDLARIDQQHAITRVAGLESDAAALTLADSSVPVGRRAERALGLLEAGRAILMAQALETRTDLTDLIRTRPDLAEEFVVARDRLARPGPLTETGERYEHSPYEARRQAARAMSDLLAEIRRVPGFTSFGLPPAAAALRAHAEHGPVVTFNISDFRSDALVLTTDGITAVELPDVTTRTVTDRVLAFHDALGRASDPSSARIAAQRDIRDVLAWLWDAVTGPVLDALGHTGPITGDHGNRPRVWWVPGGLLGLLPIHAAGHHTHRADPDFRARTVLDRVISSYTPTITALAHSRRHELRPTGPDRALIVAMPTTPGLPDDGRLPHVDGEAEFLRGRFPAATLLTTGHSGDGNGQDRLPTTARVLSRLATASVAHFACHGHSDPADPSQSRLLLHDWRTSPLTVTALAHLDLDHVRLAYLSACSTAQTLNRGLVDESIHLTSAFQIAGFPHVIGTLWSVTDQVAAKITDEFYRRLDNGTDRLDIEHTAQALHDTIRAARDELPVTPSLWAAHVHAGA
jgi:tetratricopeptide (TPR) repeat protein